MGAIKNSFRSEILLVMLLSILIAACTILLGQYAILLLLVFVAIFIEVLFPRASFYILAILIPLPIDYNAAGIDINASIPLLIIIVIVRIFKPGAERLTKLSILDIFPLIFMFVGALSLFNAESSMQGWLNGYIKSFIVPVLYYFYIKAGNFSARSVMNAVALSLTIFSLYALYQFFIVDSAAINYVGNSEYRLSGGILSQGNGLAMVLERIIPFCLLLTFNKTKEYSSGQYKIALIFFTAILFLTLSRGGWIAFAIILLLTLIVTKRSLLLIVMATMLAGSVAFIEPIRTRLFTDGSTLTFRTDLWEVALSIFKNHYMFGIPFNDFVYYYDMHFSTFTSLSRAHNIFLDIIVFTGVTGAIFFAVFFTTIFVCGYKFVKRNRVDNIERTVVLSFMFMLFMMFIHGQIDSPLFSYSRDMFLWLEYAIFVKIIQKSSQTG